MNTHGGGKFIGARLTEAREAMGLSVANLADLVSVSRAMVYFYEDGINQPSDEVFERMCFLLRQPARFFFHPNVEQEYRHEMVHFRALKSITVDERLKAGARLRWIIEYFSVLEHELTLPKTNFPIIHFPDSPMLIDDGGIEDAAWQLRLWWNLGSEPVPNLVRLLEKNGAVVGQIFHELHELDGASFWSEKRNRPFILLNMAKQSHVRSRFDAAHELGHMVLHRNISEKVPKNNSIYNLMESQAHKFAAAFLLPRNAWVKDVGDRKLTLAVFKSLKPKWRVSIKAMIVRSFALRLLSDERRVSLLKQLSSKGWNKREPYDNLWDLEKQKLFEQATSLLAKNGFTADVIFQVFPRNTENISEITGLPPSFFEADDLPIRLDRGTLN